MLRKIYSDHRGYISPLWHTGDCNNLTFVEDRISYSKRDVIRGFHGDTQTYKLVTCLYGSFRLIVWDILANTVVWDEIMSAENGKTVLVYPNTLNAHQCLTDCILYYKWSQPYNLASQFSVNYNDKTINPQWSHIDESKISQRDTEAQSLEEFLAHAHG